MLTTPSAVVAAAPVVVASVSVATAPPSSSTSSCSSSTSSPPAPSTMATTAATTATTSTSECKRPKHYLVHSHSSRHVQLTEEITAQDMALSIMQAQYHVYHTDLSGYLAGGTMVQDALTKYALGATPKDLYQTYKRFRQDKERIPPVPTITITSKNWRDWLGHKSYYHDYLDFFDHELRQLESTICPTDSSTPLPLLGAWSTSSPSISPLQDAMAKMVSDYLTPLIPGLCASMDPLIHLGYGVEFGSRLAIAEGLAYTCVSYQSGTTCFIPSTVPLNCMSPTMEAASTTTSFFATRSSPTTSGSNNSTGLGKRSPTIKILNMVRNDKRLDGMFDAGFQGKLNVVMSSRVSLLKSYLGMWTSQVHSVSEALLDLSQTSSVLLFTATNRFGDEQQLDKKLGNILLASHAARFLVKVLTPEAEQMNLLKAIWMSLLATFVVQGRPKLTTTATTTSTIAGLMGDVSSGSGSDQEQDHSTMSEHEDDDDDDDDDGSTHHVEDSDGYKQSTKGGMAMNSIDRQETIKIPTGRWKAVALEAIHADHQIVPKIVRSLWWAERVHGACGDLFYDAAVRAIGEDPASDESTGPGF